MSRFEDQRHLTGHSRYTEDLQVEDCLHAVFVRSAQAHARIRSLDTDQALAAAGVVAVITGKALVEAGVKPLACSRPMDSTDGTPFFAPVRPALALDEVRYVGQPVAMVIARSLNSAQDAAELVEVGVVARVRPDVGERERAPRVVAEAGA